MSTLSVPEKWVSSLDEKKFEKISRWQLHYRIGSGAWAELPVGSAVSQDAEGLVVAPTLSPGPLTIREFLGRAYELGVDHFLADQSAGTGAHPKAADLKILLLDERDKTIGECSKKLRRSEAQSLNLRDDGAGMEQVTESANVLAQTVRSLGGHVVQITSIEARARNDYESIMATQMRELSGGWQELNKDREKISIDLVEAAEAKVRAEETHKRLELEKQLAEDKGFFDSSLGEKLGGVLIMQLVPKLMVFVESALTTGAAGLEKRKMKAQHELKLFKRELEAEDEQREEKREEIGSGDRVAEKQPR